MQAVPQFPFHNSMMQLALAAYSSRPVNMHPALIGTPYAATHLNYRPVTGQSSEFIKGKSFTIEALLRPDNPRESEDFLVSRVNKQRFAETHPYHPLGATFRPIHHVRNDKSKTCDLVSWKGSKNKRVRTIFTPDQLERLEAEFERQQYMVGTERFYLASSLNLSEAQVKVWFQNRRIKWRKQNLEKQHARMRELDLYSQGESESGSESDDSEQ